MSPVSIIFIQLSDPSALIDSFIYSSEGRFDFRFIARARACLITVARLDTVSSLTERISKAKRRSVYRPRTVGVGSVREWSVCSRLAAWRLRAASLGFCALLGEPSKKSPMPGEMGARVALEGGGSVAELEGDGEGLKGGELYTRGLSPPPPSLPLFFVVFFFFFCVFVFFFLSLSFSLLLSALLCSTTAVLFISFQPASGRIPFSRGAVGTDEPS